MRVAIVSDVHGNLHALEAALTAIDDESPDEIWCLGDLVGYGPRPNECCSETASRTAVARWTRGVLGDDERAYLDRLAPNGAREDVGLYHGSPRDPVWEYVLSAE